MKKLYRKNERGVALLFALGMLALLLVLGLAFVANSLLAQKTARNSSSRTQARMLANSALNRAMAAIMVYDVSHRMETSTSPAGFGGIYSMNNDTTVSADSLHPTGILTGDESLLLLPENDSLVAKNVAVRYNQGVKAFPGNWFYFFNGKSGDDKRIIGRAAWQVVSAAPPILYPVFLRGTYIGLAPDGSWKPADHRWGRDIDEVNFSSNTPLLKPVVLPLNDDKAFVGDSSQSSSYSNFYNIATGLQDADKRWFEKWFMPEPSPLSNDQDRTAWYPTMLFSDTYTFIRNNQRRNYMRFNISDFAEYDEKRNQANWKQKYPGSDDDRWYARFGSGAPRNNDDAIKNLTRESADALPTDKFDYDVDAKDRSGLPFLRRIGNDKGTFADLAALRKQIAANFNDYCDADNIPTSNVSAENWWKMTDWSTNAPLYTGNEKTPYLYELGFKIGMVQDTAASPAVKGLKIGTISTTPGSTNYKVNVPVSGVLRVAPMIKLANVYKFNPADGVKNLKVGVDLESLKLKVRLKFKASVTISYVDSDDVTRTRTIDGLTLFSDSDTEYEKVLEAVMPVVASEPAHILSFAADADVDNSGNANPYPLLVPKDANNSDNDKVWKNLEIKGVSAALTITPELLKNLALPAGQSALPSTFTIDSVSVQSVQEVKLLNLSLKTGRLLLAGDTNGKSLVGLDWVKPLEVAKEITATDMVLDFADAAKAYPALLLGGILNYDPRQNLNAGDWKLDDIKLFVSANFRENKVAEIGEVMLIESSSSDDKLIGFHNGTGDFAPNGKNADSGDKEEVTEPGAKSDKFISTAFIRNAPMMSPWEIGFIHRGVKWQTINIKKAGAPGGSGTAVKPEDFTRIGDDKWDAAGTTYAGGDGAILEQIKMSDRSLGYGKVNVNMLRTNYFGFDSERDKNIVFALFNGLKKQNVEDFFTESTRTDDKLPAASQGGAPVDFNDFNAFVQDDSGRTAGYYSRAHFLHAKSSMFINIAGGSDKPDAQQEEIIGKVINLLSADEVSPSQIQVVIVAQSIEDKAGQQVHLVEPVEKSPKDCKFGEFEENYDDVTGEVKMFVTIDRDANGKLTVRRIDYIE